MPTLSEFAGLKVCMYREDRSPHHFPHIRWRLNDRKGGLTMLSYAKTISARPLPDYKVAVVFNNGQSGIFDCKYLLNYEASASLADYGIFNQVRAEHGTLCWPNDIDVAPETVWEASDKQYMSELFAV